jgi:hypothetical protein
MMGDATSAVYVLTWPPAFLWYLALAVTTSTVVGFAYQVWLAA